MASTSTCPDNFCCLELHHLPRVRGGKAPRRIVSRLLCFEPGTGPLRQLAVPGGSHQTEFVAGLRIPAQDGAQAELIKDATQQVGGFAELAHFSPTCVANAGA